MAKIPKMKCGRGFAYSAAPQGSPEWVTLRIGKITASRLGDWMAVSKAKKELELPFEERTPLKARLDYEKELAFEKQFHVPFTRFVTQAMEEGKLAENLVAEKYSKETGLPVEKCGAFYSDHFVASPDRLVGTDGLLEVKWLYDTSFMEVLSNGVPDEYYLQVQGQLLASGRDWCDFAAGNGTTGKFKVIRVKRDPSTMKQIKNSLVGLDNISETYPEEGMYSLEDPIEFELTGGEGDPWS